MRSLHIIFVALFVMVPLHAETIFVSPTGNNSGAGTIASPYQTIQYAVNQASAGDVVEIRAGTYRESVVPPNDGTSGNPITIRAYNNEEVIISGGELVTGSWTNEGNGIWSVGGVSQFTSNYKQDMLVFMDGEPMFLGRHPNLNGASPAAPPRIYADSTGSANWSGGLGMPVNSSTGLNQSSNYWQGADVHITPSLWWHSRAGVVESSSNGQIYIRYQFGVWDPYAWNGVGFGLWIQDNDYFSTGDPFFIENHLNTVDEEKEWYWNSTTNRLYLKTPGGVNPSGNEVEYRQRDFGLDLSARSHYVIEGIQFHMAAVTTDNESSDGALIIRTNWDSSNNFPDDLPLAAIASASDITFDNIRVIYGFYSRDLRSGKPDTQWTNIGAVTLSGTDIILQNSYVQYSSANGVTAMGRRITVDNNFVYDTATRGSNSAGVSTGFDLTSAFDIIITNNTISRSGRHGIMLRGLDVTAAGGFTYNPGESGNDISHISHNLIYDILGQTSDGAGIYFYQTFPNNPVDIDHNIIYNVRSREEMVGDGKDISSAIYMDGQAGNQNWSVHHNLMYDTGAGIITNGPMYSISITNNTMHNMPYSHIGTGITFSHDRTSSEVVHNILSGAVDAGRDYIWYVSGPDPRTGENTLYPTDPLYADSANGDFSIPANSPAASATSQTFNGRTYNEGYRGAFEPGQAMWTAGATAPVTSLTPIQEWRDTHFGVADNAGDAENSMDVDNDGYDNLIEYALAGTPDLAESAPLCQLSIDGTKLKIDFNRHADHTDIDVFVEESIDLVNWTPIAESIKGAAFAAPHGANTASLITDGGGSGEASVSVKSKTSFANGVFLRVRVEH